VCLSVVNKLSHLAYVAQQFEVCCWQHTLVAADHHRVLCRRMCVYSKQLWTSSSRWVGDMHCAELHDVD
jgi:hypothetical protein